MSVRVRCSHSFAAAVFAVVLGAVCFVPGCGNRFGGGVQLYSATDDAPIRVKNKILEVDLLRNKFSDDKWEVDPNEGTPNQPVYQPSRSERGKPEMLVLATTRDGAWCNGQPFRTKSVRIEYGTASSVTNVVTIRVTGNKFKVQFQPDKSPKIMNETKLRYPPETEGPETDFLYKIVAPSNGTPVFECKAASPNSDMVVHLFEDK